MKIFKFIFIVSLLIIPVYFLETLAVGSQELIQTQGVQYSFKETKFLEQADGKEALQWAKFRTKITKEFLHSTLTYQSILKIVESALYDPKKNTEGIIHRGYIYNYWNDDKSPQGIWRRTSLINYAKDFPKWEVLIDFDQLSKKLKNKVVFHNASSCPNQPNLFLIHMSFGGKDETFFYEWDLLKKDFVDAGFAIKNTKGKWFAGKFTKATWINSKNILFNPVLNKIDTTESLYPNSLYLWRRGEPIEKAKKIYDIPKKYLRIWTERLLTDDNTPSLIYVAGIKDFYNQDSFILDENLNLVKAHIPSDSTLQGSFKEDVFLLLRSNWRIKNIIVPKGSLIALHWKELLKEDIAKTNLKILFTPTSKKIFDSISVTKDTVFLTTFEKTGSKIYILQLKNKKWTSLKSLPLPYKKACVSIFSHEKEEEALIKIETKIVPPTMYLYNKNHILKLIRRPLYLFNSNDYILDQRDVRSVDGVMIPYFIVYKKGIKFNGLNPTILTAYGGFQMINFPYFSRIENEIWIKNGGVIVLANIRGGGEFGPDWHNAAIKEKRQTSFDDFIAVAKDLIKQKITSPSHLGIMGESNGGLLVSVAMTQHPELFGAIVSEKPILDMVRYIEFGAGYSWIAEYGDPRDPNMLFYLKKYSPLENISLDKKYPPVLITSSVWDQRVHPWHARIFQYKLEKHSNAKAYFLESQDAGHGYGANLNDIVDYITSLYTFLALTLKLDIPQ